MKPLKYIILAIFAAFLAGVATKSFAQWSADSKVSTTDTSAVLNENMAHCLALSGDSVHVVWYDKKTDSAAVYYKHSYDAGMTWGTVIRIAGISQSLDLPSIAVNGSTVHITWRDNTTTVPTSYYRRSLDGGNTWGNSVSMGNYVFWPNVTCSGSNVFVGLNDSHTGNSEVYLRRSTDNGTTWGDSVQISNAPGRSEDQSVSTSDGYVYLVWNDNRTGIMQTWYRRSTDNGVTWGAETQLTNTTGFAYFPIVYATGANVDVAWGERTSTGNIFDIFFKHSTDHGVTWSPQQQLTHGTSSSAYPTIARNGKNIHMVWATFGGDVYYEHSGDDGATWDPMTSIVGVASSPLSAFIALSAPVLHVIWIDKREGHPEVYYKRNPTGNPIAKFMAPSAVDFGSVKLGVAKDTTITLRNPGSLKINILSYSIFDPANGFILVDTSVHSIAAQDSAVIKIRFEPFQRQSYTGIISIATDESSLSSYQIMLTGKGIDGNLVAPASIDFGDVKLGTTRDTSITLQNNGIAPLNITGYYLTDPSNGFILTDTTAHQISSHASSTLILRFNASKLQSFSGTLTITTDESGQTTHRIILTGRGINSKLTFSPSILDFGNVDSGKSIQKTLTITNTGTASATIDSFIITGSAMFIIDSATSPITLAAGEKSDMKISFHPTISSAIGATLTIGTAEGSQPQVIIKGIGVGTKDTITQLLVRTASSVLNLLEVTPNPASQYATLKIGVASHLENVIINFYDAAGSLCLTQFLGMLNEGVQRIPLTLPQISGVSFLRITSSDGLIGRAAIIIAR